MLRSVSEFLGYGLAAEDGDIGRCHDLLFDDVYWTVRYMVADTGRWLPGRRVLVSPIAFEEPDWDTKRVPVRLTKEQIENSPPLDQDAPVSRQHEIDLFNHYGWPYYWVGHGMWGAGAIPSRLYIKRDEELVDTSEKEEKTHLRSVKEVIGYHIQATDGEIGHVEDFIADDENWAMRYMVVDTRNWLPGRKVLVVPGWIRSVEWSEKTVNVDLSTEAVKNSPKYDPSMPVNREYEKRFYDYYGRPRYWE